MKTIILDTHGSLDCLTSLDSRSQSSRLQTNLSIRGKLNRHLYVAPLRFKPMMSPSFVLNHFCALLHILPSVNFINILHTHFSYERHFWQLFLRTFNYREKLQKWRSYKKRARKMLMKLTPWCRNWISMLTFSPLLQKKIYFFLLRFFSFFKIVVQIARLLLLKMPSSNLYLGHSEIWSLFISINYPFLNSFKFGNLQYNLL